MGRPSEKISLFLKFCSYASSVAAELWRQRRHHGDATSAVQRIPNVVWLLVLGFVLEHKVLDNIIGLIMAYIAQEKLFETGTATGNT